jgi:hypothetical protein
VSTPHIAHADLLNFCSRPCITDVHMRMSCTELLRECHSVLLILFVVLHGETTLTKCLGHPCATLAHNQRLCDGGTESLATLMTPPLPKPPNTQNTNLIADTGCASGRLCTSLHVSSHGCCVLLSVLQILLSLCYQWRACVWNVNTLAKSLGIN